MRRGVPKDHASELDELPHDSRVVRVVRRSREWCEDLVCLSFVSQEIRRALKTYTGRTVVTKSVGTIYCPERVLALLKRRWAAQRSRALVTQRGTKRSRALANERDTILAPAHHKEQSLPESGREPRASGLGRRRLEALPAILSNVRLKAHD